MQIHALIDDEYHLKRKHQSDQFVLSRTIDAGSFEGIRFPGTLSL